MSNPDENRPAEHHVGETYQSSFVGKLLGSSKLNDLKLVCEGRGINVHKAVVCPQSRVIEKLVTSVEARDSQIQMGSFDLATVERMVEFMYTGEYSIAAAHEMIGRSQPGSSTSDNNGQGPSSPQADEIEPTLQILRKHVRVNAIAECYDIPRLRDTATGKIQDILYRNRFSVALFCGVLEEAQGITHDNGFYQMLASFATVYGHLGELVQHEKFKALDIMRDPFGRHLVAACARLVQRASDDLKAAQQLQTQGRLDPTNGRTNADLAAIANMSRLGRRKSYCSRFRDCPYEL